MLLMGNKITIRDSIVPSATCVAIPLITTNTSAYFGNISFNHNQEYLAGALELAKTRFEYQTYVDKQLTIDPRFNDYRSNGVTLAWKHEQFDLQMGGNGSREYTLEQRAELLERGKIRGIDGHHINSVGEHRSMQANPDNIVFVTKEEHFEAHGGNWQNQTTGDTIDRAKMNRITNMRRVVKNEIRGLGISAAIGFGVGVTISAIIELSRTGLKDADIPLLIKRSILSGIESASITSITYVVGRGASYALETLFNLNPIVLTNVISVGAISTSLGVVYQLAKMRIMGVSKEEAYDVAGKQATISIASVALTALATGLYGGIGGIIASVGFTVVYLGFNVGSNIHNRALNEKIRAFTVEQYRPVV